MSGEVLSKESTLAQGRRKDWAYRRVETSPLSAEQGIPDADNPQKTARPYPLLQSMFMCAH
jgi:hypothetical protein